MKRRKLARSITMESRSISSMPCPRTLTGSNQPLKSPNTTSETGVCDGDKTKYI